MRILVGLGPGAAAAAALAYAAALALGNRGRLTVLSAVTPPALATCWAPQLPEDPWRTAEGVCEQRLRAAARALPPELPVTTLLRRGNPADALIAELHGGGYDTLVVGSGRRCIRRVLRSSTVPVVVVPAGR